MPGNRFDPNGHAVASAAFVHAGVAYKLGQPFPHRDLGLHTTDLRGLWLADRINFTDARAAKLAPPARPAKQLRR